MAKLTKKEKKLIVEASLRTLRERLGLAKIKNKKHSEECSKYNLNVKNGMLKPLAAARIRRSDSSIL